MKLPCAMGSQRTLPEGLGASLEGIFCRLLGWGSCAHRCWPMWWVLVLLFRMLHRFSCPGPSGLCTSRWWSSQFQLQVLLPPLQGDGLRHLREKLHIFIQNVGPRSPCLGPSSQPTRDCRSPCVSMTDFFRTRTLPSNKS